MIWREGGGHYEERADERGLFELLTDEELLRMMGLGDGHPLHLPAGVRERAQRLERARELLKRDFRGIGKL